MRLQALRYAEENQRVTQARRTEQLRAEAAQKEEQVAADAGKTHDIAR
jgi:hypothetical protein